MLLMERKDKERRRDEVCERYIDKKIDPERRNRERE